MTGSFLKEDVRNASLGGKHQCISTRWKCIHCVRPWEKHTRESQKATHCAGAIRIMVLFKKEAGQQDA